jgi:hypothetical protein
VDSHVPVDLELDEGARNLVGAQAGDADELVGARRQELE